MLRIFLVVNLFFLHSFCCPPNALQGLTPNDCYVFSTSLPNDQQKLSFSDASDACGEAGGIITSITSALEANFLLTQARNLFKNGTFWTGALKFLAILYSNLENPWMWLDYKNFTYTNWAIGEPRTYSDYLGCDFIFNDTYSNVTFLGMVVSITDGKWFSVRYPFNISEIHWYVCKVPPVNETCATSQQHLYMSKKFESSRKTLNFYCQEQVDLDNNGVFNISGNNPCFTANVPYTPSSFHSFEDTSFFYQQAVSNAQNFFCNFNGQYANSRSYMGLRYNDGNWTWMDGSNLDYINWSPGYPIDPESFGECAYFNMDAQNPNELINGPCYGVGSPSQDIMFCRYYGKYKKYN